MYQNVTFPGFIALLQLLRFVSVTVVLGGSTTACAAREPSQQAHETELHSASSVAENTVVNSRLRPNQRFTTLDDFLAHLRNVEAPIDGAWYREIQPGVYKLETGNRRRIINQPGASAGEKVIFTRQELVERGEALVGAEP